MILNERVIINSKYEMSSKIVDAAVSLSRLVDNSVVAISGFNMATTPEYLILEMYKRYSETGHPKGIFIISDVLPAVPGRALDQVAERLYRDPAQDFLRGVLIPFRLFRHGFRK